MQSVKPMESYAIRHLRTSFFKIIKSTARVILTRKANSLTPDILLVIRMLWT
jgi:hypothetical protein